MNASGPCRPSGLSELEQQVLAEFTEGNLMGHVRFLCGFDRPSGNEGERAAVDYIVSNLRRWGVDVRVHEFDAYLSFPVSATVDYLGDGRGSEATSFKAGNFKAGSFKAKTRSFSGSTPPEGVVGEVVYVPGGSDMFRDTETKRRLAKMSLAGKIVLSDGGGRENMITAQRLGAVGYIHMWPSPEDALHEGIVTPVWGTPTPESAPNIPNIPVATVTNSDGRFLASAAAQGKAVVRLFTKTETKWVRLALPVANIPGRTSEFVLAAGHLDSWHRGATDNASGNAVCLELARVFKKLEGRLLRGLRVAWWPGHSTGRYAGSTWYADHAWQDLHDNCVTYINIDSPGPLGATDYSTITATSENAAFACDVVATVTGQKVGWERPVRAGDQSFWGPGVTSMFMLLSERPKGQRAAVGGSGSGWWWHNEADTLDKVDPRVLVTDASVHALGALRICTTPLLPFDMTSLADEVSTLLEGLARAAGEHLDLGPLVAAVQAFGEAARRFEARKDGAGGEAQGSSTLNKAMLEALRGLTPVSYTTSGPFGHDAAVPIPPFPGLDPVKTLADLAQAAAGGAGAAGQAGTAGSAGERDRARDLYEFTRTKLLREANRVVHALRHATEALG